MELMHRYVELVEELGDQPGLERFRVTIHHLEISLLVDRMERGQYPVIDPKLNQNYVDRILLGFPVPPIVEFLNFKDTGGWEILAGQDVLETIVYVLKHAEKGQFRNRFRKFPVQVVSIEESFGGKLPKEQAVKLVELLKGSEV